MKKTQKIKLLASMVISAITLATSADGAYREHDSYRNPSRTIRIGSAGYGTNQGDNNRGDDRSTIQRAIDDVARAGGGRVIIPAGSYRARSLSVKDNVHILISGDARIRINPTQTTNPLALFSIIGRENCSVRSFNGRFRVDMPDHAMGVRAVFLRESENILLSGFDIRDPHHTKFPSFEMTLNHNGSPKIISERVSLRNSRTSGDNYGYGMVQHQAGREFDYRDLSGAGGVVVRFETDFLPTSRTVGRRSSANVRNASVTHGQAAVMFQPNRATSNGTVTVDAIKGVRSEFSVLVEGSSGSFDQINIRQVSGYLTLLNAPTRFSHLRFYDPRAHSRLHRSSSSERTNEDYYRGPTIAVVGLYERDYPVASNSSITFRFPVENSGWIPSWIPSIDREQWSGDALDITRRYINNNPLNP